MTHAIDLEAVEKKIQEEYVRARDALQTLRKYLGNGSNGHVPPVPVRVIDRTEESEIDYANAVETGDVQTIIDKVDEIIQADPLKKWTVPTMVGYLKQINFPLVAKKPQATMGLVFGKLAHKRKTIVRVRKGSGRTPHIYRAIPRAHQEDASKSDIRNERVAS